MGCKPQSRVVCSVAVLNNAFVFQMHLGLVPHPAVSAGALSSCSVDSH
jgi:hypothetical protein